MFLHLYKKVRLLLHAAKVREVAVRLTSEVDTLDRGFRLVHRLER